MLLQSVLFILGLGLLVVGAEWLVNGSSRFARLIGIRPLIIGLTVVAFGTSAPEAAVSIIAAIKGAEAIALGDIIGSNIANIGLVLGIAAMIRPLKIEKNFLRKEVPVMIASAGLLYLLALDSRIDFFDGVILLAGIVLFIVFLFYKREELHSGVSRAFSVADGDAKDRNRSLFLALAGLVILLVGAYLMVYSGVLIAKLLGIGQWIIALTVFAVGTSLPELATSAVSAYRNKSDIAVGNIIGSNIFNILFVLGLASLICSLGVSPGSLRFELPVMLLFSIALFPLMKTGFVITRLEGLALFGGYLIFLTYLVKCRILS
jgi:cation:H+ antiporter